MAIYRRCAQFPRGLLALALLVFAGCGSDPKEPVYSNYEVALRAGTEQRRFCVSLARHPLIGKSGHALTEPVVEFASSRWGAWEELVAAGMYRKEEVRENYNYRISYDQGMEIPVLSYRYTLTDSFKKFVGTSDSPYSDGNRSLCLANYQFDKVVSATEPRVVFGGLTAVSVTYSLALENLPNELASARTTMEKYFPEIFKEASSKTEDATLLLTKEGWKLQKMIKDPTELIRVARSSRNGEEE